MCFSRRGLRNFVRHIEKAAGRKISLLGIELFLCYFKGVACQQEKSRLRDCFPGEKMLRQRLLVRPVSGWKLRWHVRGPALHVGRRTEHFGSARKRDY
jgi:hypothetical protein